MQTLVPGHSESNETRQNFCTFDNQLLIKFWLPTFSTMRTNSESLHRAEKHSRSIYGQPIPAPTFFSVIENRVCIYRSYSTNEKIN